MFLFWRLQFHVAYCHCYMIPSRFIIPAQIFLKLKVPCYLQISSQCVALDTKNNHFCHTVEFATTKTWLLLVQHSRKCRSILKGINITPRSAQYIRRVCMANCRSFPRSYLFPFIRKFLKLCQRRYLYTNKRYISNFVFRVTLYIYIYMSVLTMAAFCC